MWCRFNLRKVVILIFISDVVDNVSDKEACEGASEGHCDARHDASSFDTMSLMQGFGVHVNFNSLTKERSDAAETKQANSTGRSAFAPLLTLLGVHCDGAVREVKSVSSRAHGMLKHHIESMGSAGSIILVSLVLVGMLTCALWLCGARRNSSATDFIADPNSSSVIGQWHSIPTEPSGNRPASNVAWGSQPHLRYAESPAAQSVSRAGSHLPGMRTPMWKGSAPPTQASLQQRNADPFNLSPRVLPNLPPSPGNRVLPPPLCPTLVLPVCEARFGVRVPDLVSLARQPSQGEIGIVGLSGNTLLRAAMRIAGNQRMLELSMPEANSAPRATVGPSLIGSRSLEIRALKGAYYGTLEMRTSGACYVVKDGITVLIIDGNTDDLQLSIRSSQGVELASVRVSTELFGGSDHVEIRVEPGVDTVLVLSVVLAVLLLSP
jgi:hypothetical protein